MLARLARVIVVRRRLVLVLAVLFLALAGGLSAPGFLTRNRNRRGS